MNVEKKLKDVGITPTIEACEAYRLGHWAGVIDALTRQTTVHQSGTGWKRTRTSWKQSDEA